MNLNNYLVEDFLKDESFFNWVKGTNEKDKVIWESWWKNNPEHHKTASEAISLLKSISFQDKGFNQLETEELWDLIKINTEESRLYISKNKSKSSINIYRHLMKVAAVVIPLILVYVVYLYNNDMEEVLSDQQIQIVREIPRGQKLTVYLPDGSLVKLNSESRITYPKPFDQEQRVVKLSGEAFFEVTPDAKRPFRVISGAIETNVLGTSFNVNAYPGEDRISVAVVTGKVSVEKLPDESEVHVGDDPINNLIVLAPTEQAIYFSDSDKAVVEIYNPREVLSWSEGTLYFDNAGMDEFVSVLQRWYGIDIIVQRDTPIKKGIVGEFHNQSLEQILMGMHEASEFDYEFNNGKLIIK